MEQTLTLSGSQKGKTHYLPIRVYYADTDCGGNVHHSRYIEFLERGRAEALRGFGIEEKMPRPIKKAGAPAAEEAVILPLVSLNLRYKAPAYHEDIITVETQIEKITGSRIFVRQKIVNADHLLVEAECCLTLITAEGSLRRMPAAWQALFA